MEKRSPFYLIESVGIALYGAFAWQVNLADDLQVRVDTIRQWRIERRPVPANVWIELVRLLSKARGTIDQAERELREALPSIDAEAAQQLGRDVAS